MPNTGAFTGETLDCIRGDRKVFEGLTFALTAGDILVLSGPNGSGKSSLLRVMAGLLRPAAGRILRDGTDLRDDPDAHRDNLHYVGHQDAIKPALSVAENVQFWAALRDNDNSESVPESVSAALAAFDLTALADLPGRLLSSGQRRRANLSRLAAAPAGMWLLDEPSVGLDAASTRTLEGLIAAHSRAGGMTVLSTHTPLQLGSTKTLALDQFAPVADPTGESLSA
ncbi:MAG: heme ABC exporter ATP-binding protein CcmA [Rhodospirillaceae bacterium]|jgi:heme exporter protein A|nr:heme ABC exporter ATP-binding protein CcmA [Rhodospirillaceae bacterium]MBT5665626.1 heme ABC exporter ATP-binding protein CcmA [Rhodospirillaceae bacterium]MBT5810288.1 heme ABC exporter ATP-binding protein CcmA [Rhodospirillaceae bacterium]